MCGDLKKCISHVPPLTPASRGKSHLWHLGQHFYTGVLLSGVLLSRVLYEGDLLFKGFLFQLLHDP